MKNFLVVTTIWGNPEESKKIALSKIHNNIVRVEKISDFKTLINYLDKSGAEKEIYVMNDFDYIIRQLNEE
ncbi:hypothetical protein EZS27_020780 [termite gut metagenome]|uniref:Uncharacterized protein n=1 Tax=termite gut metagenome TaxID=433724 RepID=A0A5J4RAD6_9ZZZZ